MASTILKNLFQIGIELSKMRAQGNDGAAALRSKLKGAQARIGEIVPTALYVNLAANSFGLAAPNSCDHSPICNSMTIASFYNFFQSTPTACITIG